MSGLEPFIFHGVNFEFIPDDDSEEQARGDCPFCHKKGHFYVDQEEQLWDCKKCGESGNLSGFLASLLEDALSRTEEKDYDRINRLRGQVASPLAYKQAMLAYTGTHWLLPTFSIRGTINNLRLWRESGPLWGTKRQPFLNTKSIESVLWGAEHLGNQKYAKARIWIAEGEWDGIALTWLFKQLGIWGKEIVVAVPGANVLKKQWLPMFSDRNVVMAYDADSPGDDAMESKGELLKGVVRSLKFIRWPLDIKNGYDISDLIREIVRPKVAWNKLQSMLSIAPRMLVDPEIEEKENKRKNKEDDDGEIKTFTEVKDTFCKCLEMSEDSIMALRVIVSVVLANQMRGDPVWTYIVAPSGGGKTALLNPLRSLVDHCIFRSNLTEHSLVSGWQGSTDPSLIPKLDGLTLVLKDLTELLAAPLHVQEGVFGVLRGIHDGHLDRSYGNQVHRKYESHFNLLAGVTVKIHGHSKASMGEKILKFQLVPRSRKDHDSIIRRAMENVGIEEELEVQMARSINGYLRRELTEEFKRGDEVPGFIIDRIIAISQLISKMRLEVERDTRGEQVLYKPQEEVGTRIAKALKKMAMLTSLTFDGLKGVKLYESVWKVVERLAFDTAIGWNLDVIQAVMNLGNNGVNKAEMVRASGLPPSNVSRRIEDLTITGVLVEDRKSMPGARVFKIVDEVEELWERSCVQEDHIDRVVQVRKERGYKIRPRRITRRDDDE